MIYGHHYLPNNEAERKKEPQSLQKTVAFFPPPGDKWPLIFLLLKKCEMVLSMCDVFFQHAGIQNLASQELADADTSSFLRGVAMRAAGLLLGPPSTQPRDWHRHPSRDSLWVPGCQASSGHRAQEGVGEVQSPAPSPNSAAYWLFDAQFFHMQTRSINLSSCGT